MKAKGLRRFLDAFKPTTQLVVASSQTPNRKNGILRHDVKPVHASVALTSRGSVMLARGVVVSSQEMEVRREKMLGYKFGSNPK